MAELFFCCTARFTAIIFLMPHIALSAAFDV